MSLLQACRAGSGSGKLQVVTSIEPLAYFVERIGGDRVSVSVMVPPGGDPHSYEPTPRQMARLGSAALFVKAGSGVEFELNWMPRFLALNRGLRVCDASEGVTLIPMTHADQHDEPAGRRGRFDPHFWLSPSNARLIAANVARSLALADPPYHREYEANLEKLEGELEALDGQIRRRLAGVKSRRFFVFHPAWGYFARDFGLAQIAAEEEGKTLTPVQMARVIGIARASGIRTVFVSPQFSSAQADAIAHDIGGSTATVDPLAKEYQENLRRAAEAFAGGMR
ncbi:MAG: zinc ABC transporter solute-binding protein [Chlorobiaceae bacterium]|nr:zinc ABC transporter solute-binding protein [Chlorobiaceae bacterium]